MKSAQVFREQLHNCAICFEEQLGRDFVCLPSCGHAFCGGCMKGLLGVHVEDGTLEQARTPPNPHARRRRRGKQNKSLLLVSC